MVILEGYCNLKSESATKPKLVMPEQVIVAGPEIAGANVRQLVPVNAGAIENVLVPLIVCGFVVST